MVHFLFLQQQDLTSLRADYSVRAHLCFTQMKAIKVDIMYRRGADSNGKRC
jgi:hypothetical protein